MSEIVVLGAGFGGITAALELRRLLPREHRVTVLDRGTHFLMGLAKLWELDGRRALDKGRRPLERLAAKGVAFRQANVTRIDAKAKQVTANGQAVRYDKLVIALGAELAPEATPGHEAAHNLYSQEGVARLGAELRTFSRGSLLFAVAATPFKCPPAPYEAAMLAEALLRKRGVRGDVAIKFTTPEPRPLPVLPAWCSGDVAKWLGERGIAYHPEHKPKAIHAQERAVEYENGRRERFDLLALVPVHRVPAVLRESGLAEAGGWVPVDAKTLKTPHPDVWAIGDCAGPKIPGNKLLPRAGVLAEAEGKVVAANVAAEVLGRRPEAAFDGKGSCYIELGDGLASAVDAEFFAEPEPKVTLREPSAEALREKERFEAERLTAWFGG